MQTDRCGNNRRQKCCAKGSGKEVKMREFSYKDTTNVESAIYDYTSSNWSHWNSNEKLKEKIGIYTRKTFDRLTTKDSCTWKITHNTESTAVWSLKTWVVGSTAGSRGEVPGRKGLWQEKIIQIIIIITIIINSTMSSPLQFSPISVPHPSQFHSTLYITVNIYIFHLPFVLLDVSGRLMASHHGKVKIFLRFVKKCHISVNWKNPGPVSSQIGFF